MIFPVAATFYFSPVAVGGGNTDTGDSCSDSSVTALNNSFKLRKTIIKSSEIQNKTDIIFALDQANYF